MACSICSPLPLQQSLILARACCLQSLVRSIVDLPGLYLCIPGVHLTSEVLVWPLERSVLHYYGVRYWRQHAC